VERLIKFLLWSRGGYRVHFAGPAELGKQLQNYYKQTATGKFDAMMIGERMFERPFEVVITDKVPAAKFNTAPLGRHLKYAAVQLERQRTGRMAYLGIGSNIGDKQANLEGVVKLLRDTPGITVKTVSPFYITAPVGYADQPDFLNGAVALETTLSPDQLLKRCQELEQELKRVRTIRWGPRTIDVDILLYEDLVLDDPNLTVPHPRMLEREFVLKPLNDIAPEALHPIEKISVSKLYQRLREQEAKS
jgi:2-amino-4-hydroxy-6-hydroxymethyldihydropteridine diphosphokinase